MHLLHPLLLAALTTALPSPILIPRATTTRLCGAPNASQLIPSSPWIVFSMNYNYQKISGSACTTYESTSGTGDAQKIKWGVDWDIAQDENADLVKGYEFVGLTQNLETRLSDIASIPAEWNWVRTNETAYKGMCGGENCVLLR
jgi:xyloglucan-specific endo-beta-1,4-glucanase